MAVVDYFYVHEKVPFAYRVSVSPPPADVSKVEFHAQTPEGRVLHTDQTLARTGSSTVTFDPKGRGATVAESPIFAVFTFQKNNPPAPAAGSTLGIPLAEPGVRAIDAPLTAKVGDHVKLKVSEWNAFIYDHPSTGREDKEANPARIDPRAKSGVKWKVDGHDLPSRGENVTLTIEERHQDKELEVEASLPAPLGCGRATAKIKVPRLAVTKLELRGPDGKPAKQFAPGKDEMKVHYEIKDKLSAAKEVKLEVFRSIDGKLQMDKPIWTKVLSEDERKDGTHDMPWKGEIKGQTACGDFAADDPHVSIEYSPYKLRISATADGVEAKPDKQEVQFEVKLKSFKIELAPKTHLKEARDKEIWDTIGSLPCETELMVFLESNIFVIKSEEMHDNSSFLKHKEVLGEGARIPILATATVLDYQDKEVRAGKALGSARVLWDYTTPEPSRSEYSTDPAKAPHHDPAPFVKKALGYDKSKSRPKGGLNCHADRGGKRASAKGAGPPVMAAADAGVASFPFNVKQGEKRWWAGFSEFAHGGELEGRSGIVFRPSRTPGDRYKVKAYLDLGHKLDVEDDTPAGAKAEAEVGAFEVWREIAIVEHVKKCAAITDPIPDIVSAYSEAYTMVNYDCSTPRVLTKAEYDTLFAQALTTVEGYDLLKQFSLPPGSQYDMPVLPKMPHGSWVGPLTPPPPPDPATPNTWVATFYGYGDFRKQAEKSAPWYKGGQSWLEENSVGSVETYADQCQSFGCAIAEEMCKLLIKAATKPGMVVLQFDWVFSFEEACDSRTLGEASWLTRRRAGFKFFRADAPTFAHEAGHALFLSHSPFWNDKKKPPGSDPDRHEAKDEGCLMSYSKTTPGFCGLCLLKLRGWNAERFDKNGPKNDIP